MNGDAALQDAKLEFSVCTWGLPSRGVTDFFPSLTVRDFLNHFYGLASAK